MLELNWNTNKDIFLFMLLLVFLYLENSSKNALTDLDSVYWAVQLV